MLVANREALTERGHPWPLLQAGMPALQEKDACAPEVGIVVKHYSEQDFEAHIEAYLLASGYVRCEPELARISYRGVPDIRLIVYRGFPLMAMIRLPTHLSDGRANLHQGAVGVGIDVSSGETLMGVQEDRRIEEHPDTGQALSGIVIPYWEKILEMAARCFEMTRLGYLGVDIVVDRDLGPLILELNARPGLAIQIANGIGLRHRLRAIEELGDRQLAVGERLEFCRQEFGAASDPSRS